MWTPRSRGAPAASSASRRAITRLGRRGRLHHLRAHVVGDAIELTTEVVEVVRHRVQVGAPGHRVLRDERGFVDLLVGRSEQPGSLRVEVDAVPAPRRPGYSEPDQLLVLVRDRRLV